MNDNEVTTLMAYALVTDTWDTSIIATIKVVALAKVYSKSKTEPGMSEYRPDSRFLVRQRRF